jgi:hypothetical protein
MPTIRDDPASYRGAVVVISVVAVRRAPTSRWVLRRQYAVQEVGDDLVVSTAASGEAELPEFCGGTVIVVDRLILRIGVDLPGAVAVDLCFDVA